MENETQISYVLWSQNSGDTHTPIRAHQSVYNIDIESYPVDSIYELISRNINITLIIKANLTRTIGCQRVEERSMEMINHLVSPHAVPKICITAHVPVAVAAFTENSA